MTVGAFLKGIIPAPVAEPFNFSKINRIWIGKIFYCRIDHSTMQRKLRPFLGVWQATRKDRCSRMQKYSRPLAGRPVTVVFWWGKTHTKVKMARLLFFVCVRCRFPGFFSAMSNTATWPHAVRSHKSLPDHFRPCLQNTWAPYYTASRDWLKPKGVSALTDRSGVVYHQSILRLVLCQCLCSHLHRV